MPLAGFGARDQLLRKPKEPREGRAIVSQGIVAPAASLSVPRRPFRDRADVS